MMEPHMIDSQLYSLVFVIWVNHVGFMIHYFESNDFPTLLKDFRILPNK